MFSSIHAQRLFRYFRGPRKYIVNLRVQVGDNYTFKDVEVIAHFKSEAFEKAKSKVIDEMQIIVKGSKSLGRVREFKEF